jgi:hypothetical protein
MIVVSALLASVLLAAAPAAPAAGDSLTQEFRTKDGFTIRLPQDWVEIPRQVLDDFSAKLRKTVTGLEKQSYDYGYQRGYDGRWFACPYLLVQVTRAGRIPEKELRKCQAIRREVAKAADRAQGGRRTALSGATAGTPLYDAENRALWTRLSINSAAQGHIEALCGTRLTEDGAVWITCYDTAADFDKDCGLFEDIIKHVTLERPYQPRPADAGPGPSWLGWDSIITGAVVGGIAAAIAGVVVAIRRHRLAVAGTATNNYRGRTGRG